MYHDIVEQGDKVAIIMDKSDLPLLIFLLGRQLGYPNPKLLETGYGKLADWAGDTYSGKFDFIVNRDVRGWSLKEKA